jgi:molecular chaperone DnaK (HSP70)
MARAEETRIVGIDLGTTLSSMAYMDEHGTPVTIPNSEGDLTTPSVILFEADGEVVVGREARRAALVEPDRVVDCVKRDMGERSYHRLVAGKTISPVPLSALILKKLKQDAEARIGPIGGVVITVPAYFDEGRRQGTIHAGQIAGLRVLDILNEPTSAALAYAFRDFIRRGGRPEEMAKLGTAGSGGHNAVVYDLGGGTLDVTVLRIAGSELTVLSTDGDVILGGRDWDDRIVDHAATLFQAQHGLDPRSTPASYQKLLQDAENAKKDLSRRHQTKFAVVFGGKELAVSLSREEFEQLTADLLFRTQSRVESALADSHLSWEDIHEVLAVGGSTRMPQVPAMLRKVSGKEPNCSLSPDEVVAHGAAIYGVMRLLEGRKAQVSHARAPSHDKASQPEPAEDLAPDVPGKPEASERPTASDTHAESGESDLPVDVVGALEALGGDIEIPAPSWRPPSAEPAQGPGVPADDSVLDDEFYLAGIPIDRDVAQSLRQTTATNVNSHSLGVVVTSRDGTKRVNAVIPRNTALPARVTKRYGTEVADQSRVEIVVVEGESPMFGDCIRIGSCFITQLPPGLKKGSAIDVTFRYDSSGCLHVHAVEVTSGASATATIMRELQMDHAAIDRARQAVSAIKVV